MKRLLLFLVLLPLCTFGQFYSNTSQCMSASDWTYQGGYGYGCVTVSNDVLSVQIGGGWGYPQTLKTGIIKALNVMPALPNMSLGPILISSGYTYQTQLWSGYFAKIENNNLVFYTNGSPTTVRGCYLVYCS